MGYPALNIFAQALFLRRYVAFTLRYVGQWGGGGARGEGGGSVV
jgi:hypothetical protein